MTSPHHRPAASPRTTQPSLAPVPLTGEQFTVTAGDYRAVITELGAGLRELTWRGLPLIADYPADELPPGAAGQLLAPWPNRIDHGRYSFEGVTYQLDVNEPDRQNAIHGLTRWDAWTLLEHRPHAVRLGHVPHGRPGYPFCVALEVEYGLTGEEGLRVSVTATNRGGRAAPYGTGSHPYLTVGAPVIDECDLQLPAARWQATDERAIPHGPVREIDGTPVDFRQPRRVGTTVLDHALTSLRRDSDGRAWARLRFGDATVALWAGAGYRWLQLYSGDTLDEPRRRTALAIEPMTCPPNAFVTGHDLIVLQPGETVTHSWGIRVG